MLKNKVKYVEIAESFAGQRLDNYLITYLKGVPKTHIYRIIRKGEVRVNKKRIDPNYRLKKGDQVRLPPLELKEANDPIVASKRFRDFLSSRILFEDDSFLIINKPSRIPVHGGSRIKLGLVEVLRSMYPRFPQLELAHRLDADTSGCLILAKKRSVLREVHALLREGKLLKVYRALTKGHWKSSQLKATEPLHKNHLKSGERIVRVHAEGKPSITLFEPVMAYKKATLVEATLETGRTHQIRVHAQFRDHSIAGDEKYGNRDFNKYMRQFGLMRLFLHAYRVEFVLPSTGQLIKVTAPLDDDLNSCLKALE